MDLVAMKFERFEHKPNFCPYFPVWQGKCHQLGLRRDQGLRVARRADGITALWRRGLSSLLLWSVMMTVADAAATASASGGVDLLVPGGGAVIDRVAFAVDGAESSHGADPRMWRFEPNGPQGPIQISPAPAPGTAGAPRFDWKENRTLSPPQLPLTHRP